MQRHALRLGPKTLPAQGGYNIALEFGSWSWSSRLVCYFITVGV